MHIEEERREVREKRKGDSNRLHFDWTINVTTVAAAFGIIITLFNYGYRFLNILEDVQAKTNVMWLQYAEDHPDKARLIDGLKGK